ncbi:hypothetical protein GCM10023113_03170 [Cellulomonas oligotrophica]|uniref:HTH marR-type domain-containing protein n=2 Tax=Cellulomonas oligotrophica TaxID=931536 RepID=A0ABQ4DA67_9CELL|nr:hypothetical protein Col01nite_17850 [Cellulomonas oligotrophica]
MTPHAVEARCGYGPRMATSDLQLFTTLVRYETRLWNQLDAQLRAEGLVPLPTLMTLDVVRQHAGSCRVQEIRQDLGITVGAASKVVDRLERDGHVVRTPHPHDRRSSLVELTRTGAQARSAGLSTLEGMLAAHLAGEPGLDAAGALLSRLLSRLDDAPA